MIFSWKNIFKSWAGVPVLILAVLAVVWLFTNGLPGYRSWQYKRAYEKMGEQYEKDTYGGKTPEETYDMFIDALKKGDVELASKYFVIDGQEEWVKTLSKFKETGELDGLIRELEYGKTVWQKAKTDKDDIVILQYETNTNKTSVIDYEGQKLEFPAGTYTNSTEFYRYPNELWKITKL